MAARVDDPDLDIQADDIMVRQNAGPKSPAAMPEASYLPIPKKLARQGLKDMVRISDARMNGTAFGTIVLHVTPEAADAGPPRLVRPGHRIRLSVTDSPPTLLMASAALSRRRPARTAHRPSRRQSVPS